MCRAQPSKTGKFRWKDGPVPKLTFPKRHKHTDVRSREHLTPPEVAKLRKAARSFGRHGERNDTMILLAYRHGLRVSELITLRWEHSIWTKDSFTSGDSSMASPARIR